MTCWRSAGSASATTRWTWRPARAADVAVFITAGAVDRSVAEATVGWMIALTHNVRIKDTLVRTGRWDDRSRYMGRELRDRTFGAIGLGGIGRATVGLLRGFGMKPPLAFDPYLDPRAAARRASGWSGSTSCSPRPISSRSTARSPTRPAA